MVEIVSVVGAAWSYLFRQQLQVSYPHYIDRVYGTKAGPLSDCNPGIVVMLLLCYVCILVVRMVYVRDLVKVGILVYRMMLS